MTNTNDTKLDMDYRPETYWGGPEEVVAKLKGQGRREAVQEAIDTGELDEVPGMIFDEHLAEPLRDLLASHDPSYLDGEDLPDYLPGEVEIARVIEEGIPSTVFSIRARPDGDVIRYRVVNDTDDVVAWGHQETSTEPLTLEELIKLIHGAVLAPEHGSGLIHGLWSMHYAHPPTTAQRAAERVSVSSPYYDQLELWYEQHRREWVAGMEQHEGDVARFRAASADPSAKQADVYVVDEELVGILLRRFPTMTRKRAIKAIELADG